MNKFKLLLGKRPQGLFLFLAIFSLSIGLTGCGGESAYNVGFDLEYKNGEGIVSIPLDSALVTNYQENLLSEQINVPAHRAIATDDFYIVTGLMFDPKTKQLKNAMEAEGKVFSCGLELPNYLEGTACTVSSEGEQDFIYAEFTSEGKQFTHITVVVAKNDGGLDKFTKGGFQEWLLEN